jgi:hypothetical protein
MKKSDKIEFNVKCVVTVKFNKYKTRAMNNKAKSQIKQHIKETLQNGCSFIDISVEPCGDDYFGDCTQQSKIKIQ